MRLRLGSQQGNRLVFERRSKPLKRNHLFGGDTLRVYDSTNTDYIQFAHDGTDVNITVVNTTDINVVANVKFTGKLGFHGTAPIAQQTGVAVSSAGIHAALVALGLITA